MHWLQLSSPSSVQARTARRPMLSDAPRLPIQDACHSHTARRAPAARCRRRCWLGRNPSRTGSRTGRRPAPMAWLAGACISPAARRDAASTARCVWGSRPPNSMLISRLATCAGPNTTGKQPGLSRQAQAPQSKAPYGSRMAERTKPSMRESRQHQQKHSLLMPCGSSFAPTTGGEFVDLCVDHPRCGVTSA